MSCESFFRNGYIELREQPPMKWMERLFSDLCRAEYPRLVDLPTGAGKTELVFIWLLALAWYGQNSATRPPVPRRLVWVVNRRVLVQQVFRIACKLRRKLTSIELPELNAVRAGLRNLSGAEGDIFEVVELRGQILADRDWAIRPAVPQLVIGTVDQIGSRLLFQGYGLGKWGRPQQAGLLGVDSWVAADEAHLVPAFALTLRQLHERCASTAESLPSPFNAIFGRLPFWLTELSATPGLPRPSAESPFSLTDEEKADSAIADRILAASLRRVQKEPLKGTKPKEQKESLVQQLVEAAVSSEAARIAVFVREVGVADKVADGIKKQGIAPDHICKITGRIRGYERDRLAERPEFQIFLTARTEHSAETQNKSHFLVGTAAAEVGLDADADVILCDFASLPTLLQRLGRLDRRGVLSRRHADGNGDALTMRVFATQEETKQKIQGQLTKVSTALKADVAPYSAKLMAGTHWLAESKDETKEGEDAAEADDKSKDETSAKNQVAPIIEAATWSVLSPTDGVCTQPKEWLAHDLARVAAGPVVVPPLTDAVLDYWSATTDERSPQLSPHPFLYGLAEDDESTPLVGVVFRLEVAALLETTGDDDPEAPDVTAEVLEIFERFAPLRSELHQMKLSAVRDWLATLEAQKHPLIFRERGNWRAKAAGESTAAASGALGPNGTLVLPASVLMRESCKKLTEDCEQSNGRDTAISDVLEGVSDQRRARYLRSIEPKTGRTGGDGAWLWNFAVGENDTAVPTTNLGGFKRSLLKKLRIGGTEYSFRYFRPVMSQESLQFLDDHDGVPGHLSRAEAEASRLAEAIAPGDAFLRTLLSTAALQHDEGKRISKWQVAFGWRKAHHALAKLHPDLEKPAPLHGFRHEWESLRKLFGTAVAPPPEIPPEAYALWSDLLLHLVGVHHGHLRPSIADNGLTPGIETEKHNPLRLEAAKRFAHLQRQLGRWRLAYLEALLKTADAAGSRIILEEEPDGN
jgi:CRISPR-associated endonuclease/helicase Cas3